MGTHEYPMQRGFGEQSWDSLIFNGAWKVYCCLKIAILFFKVVLSSWCDTYAPRAQHQLDFALILSFCLRERVLTG